MSAAGFIVRLDEAEQRLVELAAADVPAGALTDPDQPSGEQWEAGQVWAHLAEFLPYWIREATKVIEGAASGSTAPVPFGRVKADAERRGAIERDRTVPVHDLLSKLRDGIDATRAFLGNASEGAWRARGVHSTLGEMDLAGIVEHFMVGHLEEHADQLDKLVRPTP